MGYSTDFDGVLRFKKPVTEEQIKKLTPFLGADCREHPEWKTPGIDLTWIDLELDDELAPTGLCWNGSEKTYDLVEKVNLIINEMRKDWPDFGLEGELEASGEDPSDLWKLKMVDGVATKVRGRVVYDD